MGRRDVFRTCVILATDPIAVATLEKTRVVGRSGAAAPIDPESDASTRSLGSASVVAAVGANLPVFACYAIWVASLPLHASARFDAGRDYIGRFLLVVNAIHILGAVSTGGLIRRRGATPSLAVALAAVAAGLATIASAPALGWLVVPMALYALGQAAGAIAGGDLLLRLAGVHGSCLVRPTSDVGMVVGSAAGVLPDDAGFETGFVVLASFSAAGAAAVGALGGRHRRSAW